MSTRANLILLVSLIALCAVSQAQPPDILWTGIFGGSYNDKATAVRQTEDGGFIVCGYGEVAIGAWATKLIKLDADGSQQWQQIYNNFTLADDVQLTSDGGFIITGYTTIYGSGGSDVFLMKTDGLGNQQWYQTYGGSNWDVGASVQQTPDGGYIIAGSTSSYGVGIGTYNVYLIKTNASGVMQWSNYFGGTGVEKGHCLDQTSDGGYIITGRIGSEGAGGDDVYLIKTDSTGSEIWHQTFGGQFSDIGYGVQQTTDGGYIITGSTWSFGPGSEDVYLIKTDALGNETWSQFFGGTQWDCGNDVIQTADGGYALTGYTIIEGAEWYDLYVVKTDGSGVEEWSIHQGTSEYDLGNCIEQTSDGGYIVAGKVGEYAAHLEDMYVVRIDSESGYPNVDVELTYVSGSPIPPSGGAIIYDLYVINNEPASVDFDGWIDISYEGGPPSTMIMRVFTNYQSGWTIDRPSTSLPIPTIWAAGNYFMTGKVGQHPDVIWDQSGFPFVKEGNTFANGFQPSPIPDAPNPFEVSNDEPLETSGYDLVSVYPNPFNPTTVISIQLSADSHVNLSVYDVSGRKVVTLVDGYRDAGVHEMTFDGSGLASGIYLCRLEAAGQQVTGKLVLMK